MATILHKPGNSLATLRAISPMLTSHRSCILWVPQSGLGRGGSRLKQIFCPRGESADEYADAEETIADNTTLELLGSISATCSVGAIELLS